MKKIYFILSLMLLGITSQAASFTLSTTTNGTYLLTTNRASVYQIEITSPVAFTMSLYDCDSLAAPYLGTNYTNAAFVSRNVSTTNYVNTFVGNNGYTNYTTNVGIWTYNVTNAVATNALPIRFAGGVAAGTYAVYNVDELFIRGITVQASTNASIVVSYRAGQ